MFLSHWFELSGIDQIMAPIDPDAPPPAATEASGRGDGPTTNGNGESNGMNEEMSFWEIVAPRQPKNSESSSPVKEQQNDNVRSASMSDNGAVATQRMVECQHCGNMTPTDGPTVAGGMIANQTMEHHPATPGPNSMSKTPHNTPALNNKFANEHNESSMFHTDAIVEEQAYLHTQVLRAAELTAVSHSNPSFLWENTHNLFTLCGALPKPPKKGKDGKVIAPKVGSDGKIVKSKNLKKIVKMLHGKPDLVYARSAGMGGTLNLRDGFTILHAACHAGNEEVVEYLLQNYVALLGDENAAGGEKEKPMLDLNERDVQGRTALHIAADQGHIGVIQLLKKAYDVLEDRMEKSQKKLLEDSSSDSDDESDEGLSESMAKLSTYEPTTQPLGGKSRTAIPKTKLQSTPKTPKSTPLRRRKVVGSRSPKPPSRYSPMRSPVPVRSPTFAGANAPVDLSGRTPLGYAATSPVPKAKKNRGEMEKVLYEKGDRSILGEGRTPPKSRCGPRGPRFMMSPNGKGGVGAVVPGSGRKVAFDGEPKDVSGTNSYLSPTPRKHHQSRFSNTPGSVATSNFATPFESPPPTIPEEESASAAINDIVALKKENPLQLQWGASEMNGWRIEMEDKILVKYALYDDGERLPPRPSSMLNDTRAIPTMGLFGVFDGHGDGGFASDFIATKLEHKLKSQPEWGLVYHTCNSLYQPLANAWTQACYDLDEDLRKDVTKPRDGGTTAIMALVSDDYMFVANVGDSRCILVKRKKKAATGESNAATTLEKPCWNPSDLEVIPMSEDHKPDLPLERMRIESSGLTVQTDHVPPDDNDPDGKYTTVHRVKKSDKELLGVARAFGDYDYKSNKELSTSRQAVVCTPDIVVREREDCEDMYLVLACDGVWDVMSNEEAGVFVAKRVAELLGWADGEAKDGVGAGNGKSEQSANTVQGEILAQAGDDLLAKCLEKGSRDNMSVLIVALPASGLTDGRLTSPLQQAGAKKEDVPVVADGTVRTLAYE